MLAAILNISIPLELGRVVNTIAFSEENRGENWDEVGDYLRRMMLSGVRLGGMYLTQVRSVCESNVRGEILQCLDARSHMQSAREFGHFCQQSLDCNGVH